MRLPYVYTNCDRHGNVRVYFRRGKTKIRLRDPVGSPAFAERYAKLLAEYETGTLPSANTKATDKTLGGLVRKYEMSVEFKELDLTTQATRRRLNGRMLEEPIFKGAKETYAAFPLDRITVQALEVLRDRKRQSKGAANDRVKALRAMFKWAREKQVIPTNPALDLHKLKVVSEGWHTWTVEEVATFEARHPVGTMANLALRLMLYTGARRSDAVRLGRQHIKAGEVRWQVYKNRNRKPVEIIVPLLAPLREALDRTQTGDLVFLVSGLGKAFASGDAFGNWFRDRCLEAGLPHCSPHGLRKAGATLAAEAGATAHQLMSMFGWANLAEAERYTKAAERRHMAAAGMGKIVQGLNRKTGRSENGD